MQFSTMRSLSPTLEPAFDRLSSLNGCNKSVEVIVVLGSKQEEQQERRMTDSSLSNVTTLCNSVQAMCRKYASLRPIAAETLEELLEKFDTMVSAKSGQPKKTKEPVKPPVMNKPPLVSVEEKKSHALPVQKSAFVAPDNANYKVVPQISDDDLSDVTSKISSIESREHSDAEVEELDNVSETDSLSSTGTHNPPNLDSSPMVRGRGLSDLKNRSLGNENLRYTPRNNESSLDYLFGGSRSMESSMNSSYKSSNSSYNSSGEMGSLLSAAGAHSINSSVSPSSAHARFKYSQAPREEQERLERKFKQQQELRAALQQQMEEKQKMKDGRNL